MTGRITERLPTTSYAVLGLLADCGEISGYDLSKVVGRSVGFFLTPAKSHIYAELRRLVSLGHATERKVEQDKRPDKTLYRITDAGRRALAAWLNHEEVEPDEIRSPFLAKLFFGRHTEPEALLRQVHRYRTEARERLEVFQGIEKQIKESEEARFPYLTLRAGLAHTRAAIRWADQVIAELEAGRTR